MADSSLPTLRRSLVEDVVDDDRLGLVFQEASEDASVVAPDGDESLVPDEGHRVVPQRDDEHATGGQLGGGHLDEALDGLALRQMGNRIAHAEDRGWRL